MRRSFLLLAASMFLAAAIGAACKQKNTAAQGDDGDAGTDTPSGDDDTNDTTGDDDGNRRSRTRIRTRRAVSSRPST
jgi:hypothetical protein